MKKIKSKDLEMLKNEKHINNNGKAITNKSNNADL